MLMKLKIIQLCKQRKLDIQQASSSFTSTLHVKAFLYVLKEVHKHNFYYLFHRPPIRAHILLSLDFAELEQQNI